MSALTGKVRCTAFSNARSTRRGTPRTITVQASRKNDVTLGPLGLAAVMALSAGLNVAPIVQPPVAFADTEEDENLSPYERRQRDLEKRRQLLREAREKASNRAIEAPVEEPPKVEKAVQEEDPFAAFTAAFEESGSTQKRAEAEAQKRADAEAQKRAAEEQKRAEAEAQARRRAEAERMKAELRQQLEAKQAPAPKAEAKSKVTQTASNKRQGPLPLFLAQMLVLGMFGGFIAAATKYNKEASELLNLAAHKVEEYYLKLEEKLAANK